MADDDAAVATLARFVAEAADGEFSDAVRHEARRTILNYFASAAAVAADPTLGAAVRVLARFSGPAEAGLIGRPQRLDRLNAAFVNAAAANFLDFDDTHLETVIHPGAPTAAAVFAFGEATGASGAAVLEAFALGAEVACRMGNMVSPGHYARGWHITATCGVFGAAAGTARLLGLDAGTVRNALGIAASQSAGLVENLANEAKNVAVGNSARNGILAALMAAEGYDASAKALHGRLGWARAMGDEPRLAALTDGLGREWELSKNTYKPYPAGIVMHAIIDACLELRGDHGLAAEAVAAVTVAGDSLLLARGDRIVANHRDARVSIHHAVAAPLLAGAAGIPEFSEAFVLDPAVIALRAKVTAELDADMPVGAARVTVLTTSGECHELTVHHARGSREKPLTDAALEDKLRELAAIGGGIDDADRLIGALWDLERIADVGKVMALT